MRRARTPDVETVRSRFASDEFLQNYALDKSAPFWHEPVANLGVMQGAINPLSGESGMLFFVGTMGNAATALQTLADKYAGTLQAGS
jgi:hypothetical protein